MVTKFILTNLAPLEMNIFTLRFFFLTRFPLYSLAVIPTL